MEEKINGAGQDRNKEKKAQGDAHSTSHGERLSKQRLSPGASPSWALEFSVSMLCQIQWMKDGLNDDGDEENEDKDNDGHLLFPINTFTLEWIVLSSATHAKIHSVVLIWLVRATPSRFHHRWAIRSLLYLSSAVADQSTCAHLSFHL